MFGKNDYCFVYLENVELNDDDITKVEICLSPETILNIQEYHNLSPGNSPPLSPSSNISSEGSFAGPPKRAKSSALTKKEMRKKIKLLHQQIRRQKDAIKNLRDLIKVYKKKNKKKAK